MHATLNSFKQNSYCLKLHCMKFPQCAFIIGINNYITIRTDSILSKKKKTGKGTKSLRGHTINWNLAWAKHSRGNWEPLWTIWHLWSTFTPPAEFPSFLLKCSATPIDHLHKKKVYVPKEAKAERLFLTKYEINISFRTRARKDYVNNNS